MIRDADTASKIDCIALLCLWWRYERAHDLAGLDFPHECPSTRGWRASRQWDDQNGAFDIDERGQLAQRIGFIVNGLPEPFRTALYVLARNRASGVQVWRSPRLPADEVARAALVAEAVEMFEAEL